MTYHIKQDGKFSYIDEGEGSTLLLLHGLFGSLSNWSDVLAHYSTKYRVIIPLLPIHDMPLRTAGLGALTDFIEEFVKLKKLTNMSVLGNSLGGHLALMFTLRNPKEVTRLVLTGSSGLFESSMGGSYPKRGSYAYIKERVEYTFYKPETATKELVDEVFEITQSIPKCLRIVAIAKSAQRHNMANDITRITQPTLLVWGLNDTITPPTVGYEFLDLMPNAELRFVDHCCHAPMMEDSIEFNRVLDEFLTKEIA